VEDPVHIDLTREEVQFVRAALTLVIFQHEELIETGRFAKELGEGTVNGTAHEPAEYEDKLREILMKLS
jgi:hypothetical protein